MKLGSSLAVVIGSLVMLGSSCGRTDSFSLPPLTTPSPIPAPPPVPAFTLSLTVSDERGPIADARVDLAIELTSSTYYAQALPLGAGRYRTGVQEGARVWAFASKAGHVQQCAATVTIESDASLDLGMSPRSSPTTTHSPAATPGRTISGVVFEVTDTGTQPVPDVYLYWDHSSLDTVFADTVSDAAGRFLLCGLPRDRTVPLGALKAGYRTAFVAADPGGDAGVDIELTRR